MSEPYPDLIARFYDAVYAKVRDGVDNDWYLDRMAAAQGPVLEIGVGTGRLFAEARRRGIDAWGIDLSPAMIACCQAKLAPEDRGRVSVADAVTMRPDRRFALACAPFRVLSHVHETGDQLRLLDAAHDCLLPGGAFVFDLYVPNLEMLLNGVPEHTDFDGEYGRAAVFAASSRPIRQTSRASAAGSGCASSGTRRTGSTPASGPSRCASSSGSNSSTSWPGRSSFSTRSSATSPATR